MQNDRFADSELQFRMLADNSPNMIFINRGGKVVYVNDLCEKVMGYTRREFCSPEFDFLSIIAPDSRELVMQNFRRHQSGQDVPPYEYGLITRDGTRIDAIITSRLIRIGGENLILGIVTDITARKQAERAHRESYDTMLTILESIDAEVYAADLHTHEILYANRKLQESFGSPLVGSRCYREFEHAQAPCEGCINRSLLDPGGTPAGVQVWEHFNSLVDRWYLNVDQAVKWIDGRYVQLQVATDITGKKKLEEEMLKARKLESIGVLAGGIAHDFNNILSAVMGYISLARGRQDCGGDTACLLQQAEKACSRATALTAQLLTFSRGGTPVLQPASLQDLLRESAGFALSGSRSRSEFTFPEDLQAAEVDAGQIGQVFHNLFINAAQAMPEGGVIRVTAENVNLGADASPLKPGAYVKITVRDRGRGIPRKHLSRVFDPYFTTKQNGSGLGLATAYSIIKKHQGHISVESRYGEGATFTVLLPASPRRAARSERREEGAVFRGNGRVLVMDDEPDIRAIMKEMLETLGYRVDTAADGSQSVRLYRDALKQGEPYALIVLDLVVPGGQGGRWTLMKLKEIDPGVKAVVTSGYSNDQVLADYREHGFAGVLTKPFQLSQLSRVLLQALDTAGSGESAAPG